MNEFTADTKSALKRVPPTGPLLTGFQPVLVLHVSRRIHSLVFALAFLVLCIAYAFATSPAVGATLAVAPAAVNPDKTDAHNARAAAISIGIPNACAAPTVLTGAISAASPTESGRLNRDGLVGVCGQSSSCTPFDASPYPYQQYDFINATSDAQCVSATINASACTSDLYSAAYIGSFNSANICSNYLAGMGFSTSSVFTYSFLVPGNGAFSIVNNAVYTNALCSSYTLTVRPCSANLAATAGLTLTGPARVSADANGTAVITYNLSYKNTGNYTMVVPSASVLMTPLVQSPKPNLVLLDYGHAGGLLAPGRMVTEDVALVAHSSASSLCLPATYTLTAQLGAGASVYQCNMGNPFPATQIFTGSLQPSPWLAEDRYAFRAQAGWNVTITVNTAFAATTFDPIACISAAPNGACLPGLTADDSFVCDFQPNFITSTYPYCPTITGTLPATIDGVYYLRVTSFSARMFAGTIGQYRAMIELGTPNTALCPTVQVLDDGYRTLPALAQNQPEAVEASSTWFSTTSPPVVITRPATNPLSPLCGRALLPMANR